MLQLRMREVLLLMYSSLMMEEFCNNNKQEILAFASTICKEHLNECTMFNGMNKNTSLSIFGIQMFWLLLGMFIS